MNRKRALALIVVVAALLAIGSFSLYTRIGVLAVGHRYWFWKASHAESEDAMREDIGRVLGATQYGVNQAENYVREIEDRQTRIRWWRVLIDMAPNDDWAQLYARSLQSELGASPQ